MTYIVPLLILIVIFAIAALALNLTIGWTGIVNLGFVGLMAIGAYASAILTTEHGYSMWVGMLAALLAAGAAAFLLSLITKTLKGDTLAIVLLGFNLAVYSLALNWTELTRGSLGIPGIPRPEILADNFAYLGFSLIVFAMILLFALKFASSRYGRMLGAVRDDELHAAVLGKDTFRAKVTVFTISGAIGGLSGALIAHYVGFIDPASFFLHQLVLVLSIVFVGGLASVPGTLLGAALMILLPEAIRFIPGIPATSLGAVRGMVFSAILLVIVMYRPKGLLGTIELPSSYAEGD